MLALEVLAFEVLEFAFGLLLALEVLALELLELALELALCE